MKESLLSFLLWLIILIPVGVFIRQIGRVRCGLQSKIKSTVLYFTYSIAPVLVYMLVVAVLVGIEDILYTAMLSEEIARSFVLVVGIACAEVLFLTAVFASVVFFFR